MAIRWMGLLVSLVLLRSASAAPNGTDVVRDLAGRVGPIIGSALACPDIARPRVQAIADKFQAVIREASSNEAERDDLTRLLDRYVADGRSAVTSGRLDCRSADRQLADLEQSLAGPGPSPGRRDRCRRPRPPPPHPRRRSPAAPGPAVRGITDQRNSLRHLRHRSRAPPRNSAAR